MICRWRQLRSLPSIQQPTKGSLSPAAPAVGTGPDNTEWPGRHALREYGLGPRSDIVPDRGGAAGAAV